MSGHKRNSGTLVLDQLRASLDGSRYSLKAVYAAIGISFGGAVIIFVLVLLLWHRLRGLYASKPLLSRRISYFSDTTVSQCEENDIAKRKPSAISIPGTDNTSASRNASINDKKNGAHTHVEPIVFPDSLKVPEKQADSDIKRTIGFRSCVKAAWTLDEKQLLQNSGLDAVIYLRALRMIRNLFALLTLFLFCTAAPINIVYNLDQPYVANLTHRDALLLLTPSLLSGHEMIPHVVLGWVSNVVVFSILWYNYRRVVALRRTVLTSRQYKSSVHNRTVMLTDLPQDLRSSSSISLSLASINPLGQTPDGVFLGQSTSSELETLIAEHSKLVKLYEDRCTSKDEVTTKYKTLMPEALSISQEIVRLTHTINRLRSTSVGRINNYAFASFSTVRSAHLTVRSSSRGSSFATVGGRENTSMGGLRMAPPPAQILWKNLKLSRSERGSKQLVVNTLYLILLVLWIVPSAFIGCFLSNLSRLGNVWPAFGQVMDEHPVLFAILQGFLAPSITTLVFTIQPLLFRRMSHLQGKVTRTEREQEVLRKLYAFFFLDNFFVFTLIGVVWDVIAQVLQQTHDAKKAGQTLTFHEVWISLRVAQRIATAIVNISSFWVMYLIRGVLGLLAGIAQPLTLIKKLTGWLTGRTIKQTAREKAESAMPQPFQYAVSFLNLLFYTTVALGFTTIQPLVLPATFILFLVAVPLKKYEICHMQVTKYESQGLFYPLVNDITLFAVGFGNLMLLCVVWVQAGWRIAAPAAPLAVTVVIFKVVTYFQFDVPFSRICLDDLEDAKEFPNEASFVSNDALSDSTETVKCYQDPKMWQPLEKPLLTFRDAVLHCANFEPQLDPFKDPKYEVHDEDPQEHMYPSGYTPVEPYPTYHPPFKRDISHEPEDEPLAPYEVYMPEHDDEALLNK